jgi:CBS domain-containing protein
MSPPENENIANLTVSEEESIKTAMRAIDNGALGIAFVVDENGKFAGLVTDGDVREAILRGTSVEDPISGIMNTQPVVITGEVTEEELLTLQNSEAIKSKLGVGSSLKVPVLDGNSGVKDSQESGPAKPLSVEESKSRKESPGDRLFRVSRLGAGAETYFKTFRRLRARQTVIREPWH